MVFQLYQDDGRVIKNRCVQCNSCYNWKVSHLQEQNLGLLDQQASAKPLRYQGSSHNSSLFNCFKTAKILIIVFIEMTNSVDPDEAAHNEPPQL